MEEHFEKTNPRVRLLMHQQLLQRLQLPAFFVFPGSVFVYGYLYLQRISFPVDMCGFILASIFAQ